MDSERSQITAPCEIVYIMFIVFPECTNRFVEIEHNSATSTISCIFLNELDTSEKVCSIQYGVCDQEFEVTETVSDTTTSDTVMLKIALTVSDRTYCYNITARNRTYTVMVGGRIGKSSMFD